MHREVGRRASFSFSFNFSVLVAAAASFLLMAMGVALATIMAGNAGAMQATPGVATPSTDPCETFLTGTPVAPGATQAGDVVIVAPFDLTFLDALIAHAEGSAVLADIAAVRGEHAELRGAAPAIAASLRDEAAILRGLRQQWYPEAPAVPLLQTVSLLDEALAASGASADSGMGGANPLDTASDALALCQVPGAFDPVFLDLMTQRSYGDIGLARLAQERAEHAELRPIAAGIQQRREAALVQYASWLAAWSSDTATPSIT